nr:ATP-dependent 6-phosphofructokinase 6-like [Tanacetum cinerariifolium]
MPDFSQEVRRRGLKAVVNGIPKTIDNDIPVIDKSFGFDTAVEDAQRAINAAHVEAESAKNDIGVVKLLGEGGLLEYVERCLKDNGHMVIIVIEGAGQEIIAAKTLKTSTAQDALGSKLQGIKSRPASHQFERGAEEIPTTHDLSSFDRFVTACKDEASGDIAGEDFNLTSGTESCLTSQQNEQQSRFGGSAREFLELES